MPTRLVSCLIIVLLATPAISENPYVAYLDDVEAKFIPDGDTAAINIRLFGIDTPESDQLCERADGSCWECGERSQQVLSGFIRNQEARYLFTGDTTHGRPVATIKIGLRDINKEMVRQGHAVVFDRFLPPDMKQEYFQAQSEAKSANRGVWQGNFIMPWDWRDGERLSCE